MNKKLLQLPFCDLEFYENYVIGIIKDGITISENETDIVTGAANLFFKKQPFVYISKRINSYSVNPVIYNSLSKNRNMVGFAVVSDNYSSLTSAEVEKLFYKRPFGIFNALEEAKKWANDLLNSQCRD